MIKRMNRRIKPKRSFLAHPENLFLREDFFFRLEEVLLAGFFFVLRAATNNLFELDCKDT